MIRTEKQGTSRTGQRVRPRGGRRHGREREDALISPVALSIHTVLPVLSVRVRKYVVSAMRYCRYSGSGLDKRPCLETAHCPTQITPSCQQQRLYDASHSYSSCASCSTFAALVAFAFIALPAIPIARCLNALACWPLCRPFLCSLLLLLATCTLAIAVLDRATRLLQSQRTWPRIATLAISLPRTDRSNPCQINTVCSLLFSQPLHSPKTWMHSLTHCASMC